MLIRFEYTDRNLEVGPELLLQRRWILRCGLVEASELDSVLLLESAAFFQNPSEFIGRGVPCDLLSYMP